MSCTSDSAPLESLIAVEPTSLQNARYEYCMDVNRQWKQIEFYLGHTAISTEPVILNARILSENAARLVYRGIKCEQVPFTHYTKLAFIGSPIFSDYLEEVD